MARPQILRPWQLAAVLLLIASVESGRFSLAQGDLPSSFDWRNATLNVGTEADPVWVTGNWVTPVRNQGGCGSCWAFGALAAVEARMKICAGDPHWNPDLSEQHLVCDPGGGGDCSGGQQSTALDYIKNNGLVFESELPYTASDTSPYWPLASDWQDRSASLTDFTQFGKVGEEATLKRALIDHGPLSSIHHEWSHVVALVGYEDTNPEGTEGNWIFKNSWGSGWDGDGYGTIPYGELPSRSGVYAISGEAIDTTAVVAVWAGGAADTWHTGDGRWTNRFQTPVYARPSPLDDTHVTVSQGSVPISEAGAVAKSLTLDGGTVLITAGRALTTGKVEISTGGALQIEGAVEVQPGQAITLRPGGTCTVAASATASVGRIEVTGGTLQMAGGSFLGTVAIVSGSPGETEVSYLVPTNNSLGTAWTERGFDDAGWDTGETGLGYEDSGSDYAGLISTTVRPRDYGANCTSTYLRIPFTVADPADVLDLTLRMKCDDGFVAYLNGGEVGRARFGGTPAYNSRAQNHSDSKAIWFEDFDLSDDLGKLRAGTNVLAIHGINTSPSSSDMLLLPELVATQTCLPVLDVTAGAINLDGADLKVAAVTVSGGTVDTGANHLLISQRLMVGNSHFAIGGGHTFTAAGSDLLDEPGIAVTSGTLTVTADPIIETVTIVSGTPGSTEATCYVPTDNSLGTDWTEIGFDDGQWDIGKTGIGYENSVSDYAHLIKKTVRPSDHGAECTGIFVRIPFDLAEAADVLDLTLRMKYDDGFVAYLNGDKVKQANISGTPKFDSRASSHPDSQAVKFEDFDLSGHLDKLESGANVLAIHGINTSPGSSDMLVLPELVAVQDTRGTRTASAYDVNVSGGIVRLDGADLNVVTMTVSGGAVNAGANRVIVGQSLQLPDVQLSISPGDTFAASGWILPEAADLTLSGGTLIVGDVAMCGVAGGETIEQPGTNLLVTADTEITSEAPSVVLGNLTVTNQPGPGPATSLDLQGAAYSFQDASVADGVTLTGELEVRGGVSIGDGVAGALSIGNGLVELMPTATYNAQVSLAVVNPVQADRRTTIAADQIVLSHTGAELQMGGTLAISSLGDRTKADYWATSPVIIDNQHGVIGDTSVTPTTGQTFDAVAPAPPESGEPAVHIEQGLFLCAGTGVNYDRAAPLFDHMIMAVKLDVLVALGGDVDGDGTIGLDDWDVFRANFGSTGADWTAGNFDPWTGDDTVDLDDWNIFRSRFGETYTIDVAGAAAAVPEPGTIVMLLGALAGLALLGRRRR